MIVRRKLTDRRESMQILVIRPAGPMSGSNSTARRMPATLRDLIDSVTVQLASRASPG